MIPMLMAGRFRGRRTVPRGPRRSKVWSGASTALQNLAPATASTIAIFTEGQIENLGKPTLARVRGTWLAYEDVSVGIEPALMEVALGITVVSTKAFTIGVTALPTPITNPEWPWLYWDSMYIGSENVDSVPFPAINRVVDSKAMRKLPPGSTLIAVFEAGAALEGTPEANALFSIRMLFMPS